MIISNLNYLESVSEENLVKGGYYDLAFNVASVYQFQNNNQYGKYNFSYQNQDAYIYQKAYA